MSTPLLISARSELARRSLVHWKNSSYQTVIGEHPSILTWTSIDEPLYFGRLLFTGVFLIDDENGSDDTAWVALRHCSILPSSRRAVVRNCSASWLSIGQSVLDRAFWSLPPNSMVCPPSTEFVLIIAGSWTFECRVLNHDDYSVNQPTSSLQQRDRTIQPKSSEGCDGLLAKVDVAKARRSVLHPREIVLHKTTICQVKLVAVHSSWVVEKRCTNIRAQNAWIREIALLKKLHHVSDGSHMLSSITHVWQENIISLRDSCIHKLPWFTMDYIGRDLGCLYDDCRICTLKEDQQSLVQTGLINALVFLQRKGIVHRDIKPANVLISADGKPVLADFGLSCIKEHCDARPDYGTPCYLPPEVAFKQNRSFAADIWALGIVLMFVLKVMPLPSEYWVLKEDARDRFARHFNWIKEVWGFKDRLPEDCEVREMLERDPIRRALAWRFQSLRKSRRE